MGKKSSFVDSGFVRSCDELVKYRSHFVLWTKTGGFLSLRKNCQRRDAHTSQLKSLKIKSVRPKFNLDHVMKYVSYQSDLGKCCSNLKIPSVVLYYLFRKYNFMNFDC